MTSKEALKEIDDILYINAVRSQVQDKILSMLEIIKQDLERLEKLEKELKQKSGVICMLESENETLTQENTKLKKVIEIIKEKKVDIPKLLANDFNNYNALAVFFGFKQLAQEEYELLKEVLDNV